MFFPGQGTQKVGMLTPLLSEFPRTVAPLLELLDTTLPPADGEAALSRIIAEGPNEAITATENAQPAILFTSIAILRILEEEFGLTPRSQTDFFLGHSLGEFTALVAAGVLRLEDALVLVRRRGEIMRDCAIRASVPEMEGGPGETGMVALLVEQKYLPQMIQNVHHFLDSGTLPNDEFLSIANHNSSTQIVLSGHLKAINACICHLRKFSGHDPRALRLNVSAPFHSMVMAPAVPVVSKMLGEMDVVYPPPTETEIISNVTALPYENKEQLVELLAKQCTATVRWAESIRYLDLERDVARWIGIGPGKVGRNLVGREVRGGMKRVVGVDAHNLEEAVKAFEQLDLEEE